MKIICLDGVDSTNEYCKRCDSGEDIIVTAKRQTAGKGTKGRSFVSDEGGLYVTVMRHYRDFSSENAFRIMIDACVAVCETVKSFACRPVIRWANDVLVGGRKICGTLIENTFTGGNIARSIVGIGLNINNTLPQELRGIATTLCAETGRKLSVDAVRDVLISNLTKSFTVDDYKSYIDWLGNAVTLKTADGEIAATAVDVDERGRLICAVDGRIEKISAAEVSLRL